VLLANNIVARPIIFKHNLWDSANIDKNYSK